MDNSIDRFMAQQGFSDEDPSRCRWHFRALQLQPLVLGSLVVVGIVFQSATMFLALAAVLAWSVVVPALNPFERLYDWLIGGPASRPKLEPAPPPRRFAQGMAATFMAITGISLALGWMILAYIFEAFLLVATGRGDLQLHVRGYSWALREFHRPPCFSYLADRRHDCIHVFRRE